MKNTDDRYAKLDEIRGLTLISMILYHFLWDLVYIAGFRIPWYRKTPGFLWQQSICWTFIFLSGFCWSLGRHHLKRGLTVFWAGGLVTVVTLIFLPQDRIIFGVLTLLGSCMLLMIPLDRLFSRITHKIPLWSSFTASFLCFILLLRINAGAFPAFPLFGKQLFLPKALYSGWFSTYLGFPMKGFFSTDYFSLLPWFFLFLAGYFLCRALRANEKKSLPGMLRRTTVPYAHLAGRRSLLIYLLHQPVLYAVTLLIMRITQ